MVLAGGDGARLRSWVREIHGDDRPKQYAHLLGPRTLLRTTLDRLALAIPVERTLVVVRSDHAPYLDTEFRGQAPYWILAQPANRGTAAAVLMAAHWVARREPGATLVLAPSDHLIVEEALFMALVTEVVGFVSAQPGAIVLLGVQPSSAEADYGVIEMDERLGGSDRCPVHRVRAFWEKPAEGTLPVRPGARYLWNTFVVVAGARALVDLGRAWSPYLHQQLDWLDRFLGTGDEAWAMDVAYSLMPAVDFSRAILQRCPPGLAVAVLPSLTWSDLGSPERARQALAGAGRAWTARTAGEAAPA